jgi:hypothetical protein
MSSMAEKESVDQNLLLLDYVSILEKEQVIARPSMTLDSVRKEPNAIEFGFSLSSTFHRYELAHALLVLMHEANKQGMITWLHVWIGYAKKNGSCIRLRGYTKLVHMMKMVENLFEKNMHFSDNDHVTASFNNYGE